MYHSNILYKSNKNVCIELYQDKVDKKNSEKLCII